MFTVLSCVWFQHDRLVVGLAALIWVLGSLAFFLALARAHECSESRRDSWTAVGATVGGLGVWATHFVAMLAYDGGMPIAFDPLPTVLSATIVVSGFWTALRVLGDLSPVRCATAGAVTVTGIGAMHFVGMSAVRTGAALSYDWGPIGLAAVLASGLFAAAYIAFARWKGARKIAVPALLSILAVCVLHFTGMSATILTPDPTLAPPANALGHEWMVGAIVAAASAVICLTAASVLLDRYLTDLRGFADATLEGLAIVREDRIIEANALFAQMVGRSQADVLGRSPDAFLFASDALPAATPREVSVEASCVGDHDGRVLEVAAHTLEYRGRPCQVLAVRDLTERKAAQRRIEHLARHDALTDLPNRALLDERLDHALHRARRGGEGVAVAALDLDRFKAVNDIFGHAEGDRVLQRVADILRGSVRATDTVARIGGDEFVVVQVGVAQPAGAEALTQRILDAFAEQMDMALDPMAVGVSIGVALSPDDGSDAVSLRQAADIALYRAKAVGRGVACFHDAGMDHDVLERRRLESDLRHAIRQGELSVVYQPLVETGDGGRSGYEALCRWTHAERGPISPELFIPLAEDTGSILSIGEWVLREACREAATWNETLSVAINISPVQLRVPAVADMILGVLTETGLSASRLELEVTETAFLKDREIVLATLHRLKAAGVRVVMDDFGTGYSSLSNLQSFPFDKIKIDRSFIGAMEDDDAARSIVRAIVGIGRSLNLPVVAEGVETEAQHRMVREEGCPQAQGYYFGRPGAAPKGEAGDAVAAA
jgi:diguanylate cyclase (GGDEF)-like protein/PAS domain S-box-containing protein